MAGVGDHPQPAAHRPDRGGPASAVAGVHAPRRGDHRPQRPPRPDGRCQRRALRAHDDRRPRRVRPPRRSPGARRRRAGGRHRLVPLLDPGRRHAAARCGRGAVRQQRPDVHARPRRRPRPGEGQRTAVLRRDGGQPVRRPAARRAAAGCRVRPAVRRRRWVVRRLGRARLRHHGPPSTPARRRDVETAVEGGDRRGLPLAVAPPRAAHDGALTGRTQPAQQHLLRHLRDLRPGGARHVDDGVRPAQRGTGHRRHRRRLAGVVVSPSSSGRGRRCASASW